MGTTQTHCRRTRIARLRISCKRLTRCRFPRGVTSEIRIVPLTVIGSVLACLAAAQPMQEPTSRKDQAETIRRMLMELHENDEFTGSVLVAQAGIVIYRDAIASTPDDARKLLTSPSNIALPRQRHSPQWRS